MVLYTPSVSIYSAYRFSARKLTHGVFFSQNPLPSSIHDLRKKRENWKVKTDRLNLFAIKQNPWKISPYRSIPCISPPFFLSSPRSYFSPARIGRERFTHNSNFHQKISAMEGIPRAPISETIPLEIIEERAINSGHPHRHLIPLHFLLCTDSDPHCRRVIWNG